MLKFLILLEHVDVRVREQPTQVLNLVGAAVPGGGQFNHVPVYPLHALELAGVLVGLVVDELERNLSGHVPDDEVAACRCVETLVLDVIGQDVEAARNWRQLVEVYVQCVSLMRIMGQFNLRFGAQLLQDGSLLVVAALLTRVEPLGFSLVEVNHHLLEWLRVKHFFDRVDDGKVGTAD